MGSGSAISVFLGVLAFAGWLGAKGISEVSKALIPGALGFCPVPFSSLGSLPLTAFSGAGHFAGCPMAQAIYGVLLSFAPGFPGSFAQFLMLLMVRVAQGILRFILETFQSFRHIRSNKSFQGTPLRYAPELSR